MISSTYIVLSLDISLISFPVDRLKDLACPFFRIYTCGTILFKVQLRNNNEVIHITSLSLRNFELFPWSLNLGLKLTIL